MNKQQFFAGLKENLRGIPAENLAEILADYDEHFTIGKEKGKTEAEIAEKLGDAKSIAKEFKTETLIKVAENKQSTSNVWRAVFSTISLSLFNLIFVVGPFLGVAATLLSLIITGFALFFAGILVALLVVATPVLPFVQINTAPLAALLISLGIASAGVFLTSLSYYLNKYFYLLTIKYLKLNLNIITKLK